MTSSPKRKTCKTFSRFNGSVFKVKKLEQLLKEITSPENIEVLDRTTVHVEVWTKITHPTKSFDIKLQNLYKLLFYMINYLFISGAETKKQRFV